MFSARTGATYDDSSVTMAEIGGCGRQACRATCLADRGAPDRSTLGAVGRGVLVVAAVMIGAAMVELLTIGPGHCRSGRAAFALQHVSRLTLRSIGIRVVSSGAPRSGPSLVVANHVSWLDVLVLSAEAPMVPVAKTEVGEWPLIGRLAHRVGALFLRRENWRELPDAIGSITSALRRGHRVQVFPEATTRCGRELNPFHRAAFQAAVDAAVVISPVALAYWNCAGGPCSSTAFVGDDDLLASLRRILRFGPVTVRVRWLPVIPAIESAGHRAGHRAAAAARAERSIARALGQPVVGRPRTTAADRSLVTVPSLAEHVVVDRSREGIPRVA